MTRRCNHKRAMVGVIALGVIWLLLVFAVLLMRYEIIAMRDAAHAERLAIADQALLSIRDRSMRLTPDFPVGAPQPMAIDDLAGDLSGTASATLTLLEEPSGLWAEAEVTIGAGAARATRSGRWIVRAQ
ncbi:MAG: hypothetical protein KDA32_11680 [Phycisphaerales bacterium]|nr:hypothetical protein [Phycisphaerales bacterium]